MHRSTRRLLRLLGTLTVVAALVAPAGPVQADVGDTSTLLVTPPLREADAEPGSRVVQTVGLTNASSEPRTIRASASDAEARGEVGQAALCTEECGYPLSSWTSVAPAQVSLPPGGRQDFTVTIDVPADASPGTHFGAVVLIPQPGDSPGVRVVAAVSSLLLLKVAGLTHEAASLASFGTTVPPATPGDEPAHRARFGGGPVAFAARVRNDGNVTVRAGGAIRVSGWFGQSAEIPVAEERVLPGSVRRLPATWAAPHLIGPYTAEVSLIYGENRQMITGSTRFWGVPWGTYPVVALMLLLLAGLGWRGARRRRRRSPSGRA